MTGKRVALFIISINSLLVWDLLITKNIVGGKLQTVLIILSLMPFIYSTFTLLTDVKFESSYFKFMATLFIGYQFILIFRGWSFSYTEIKTFMQNGSIFWPFLVPLFIFFDKTITTLGLLIKWIFYSGVFFLIIGLAFPTLLLNRSTAETFIGFSVPCGFLLLNAAYLSNKKVNITFVVIFLSIVSMTLLARRSGLVTFLGFVTTAYIINKSGRSTPKLFRYLPIIVILGVFLLFNQSLEHVKDAIFNKLVGRISEDTRSDLFDMFFNDMKNFMVFGKGMNGSYYFPLWGFVIDGVSYGRVEYRYIIENGYLQLLLTGGIVHILLYTLIMIPAAIQGIFRSANQLTKACGIVILLRMLDMFFYGLPCLNLSYILVWICVGVCYKASIRKLTNDEIMTEFKKIDLP